MDKIILKKIQKLRKTKHDFRTIKKVIGEDRLREFINSIYPKFSVTEIEIITGIPDSTLGFWLKKLNMPSIRHHVVSRAFPGKSESEMIVSQGGLTYIAATIKMTPELAYLIGFVLGDGSVQQYMIEAFNKDRNLREVIFKYMKPYGTITKEERPNGLWRLRLSNGRIANLIKDKNGIREDTLDYIFSNDELAGNFIAAFWDAEGSVLPRKYGYCVYLYNSNSFLLDRIYNYLKSNNIKFSILNLKQRTDIYFINDRRITPRKLIQRISIFKSSYTKWINQIGRYMNHTNKKKIINDIMKIMEEK